MSDSFDKRLWCLEFRVLLVLVEEGAIKDVVDSAAGRGKEEG